MHRRPVGLAEGGDDCVYGQAVEPIPDFPALLATGQDADRLELGEVAAYGRELDVEDVDEFAYAMLFLRELANNPDPGRKRSMP